MTQSETTTLSAAPVPVPVQEAVPQPAQQVEQVTTNAKGFQQVTAWQVQS